MWCGVSAKDEESEGDFRETHLLSLTSSIIISSYLSKTKQWFGRKRPDDALDTLVKLVCCCKIFGIVQTVQNISHFPIVRYLNKIVTIVQTDWTDCVNWKSENVLVTTWKQEMLAHLKIPVRQGKCLLYHDWCIVSSFTGRIWFKMIVSRNQFLCFYLHLTLTWIPS